MQHHMLCLFCILTKTYPMALSFSLAWTSLHLSMRISTQSHDPLRLLFTAFSKKNKKETIHQIGSIEGGFHLRMYHIATAEH